MPLTNAQKQSRQRQRTKEKLARYEGALREIADSPGPFADEACWHRVDTARQALDNTNTKS